MEDNSSIAIQKLVYSYSSSINSKLKETAIILAAGHGKRIKSQTSKMLHKIWEVPTVVRVRNACEKGLSSPNIIVVVGIKAEDVIVTIGKKKNISYTYQEVQNGTGHAVQIALNNITDKNYNGTVYVFPGDMGLIDAETVCYFRDEFQKSNADMMVLTGIFEGPIEENYYGRIVRTRNQNAKKSKSDGRVIEIIEYKDILNFDKKKSYVLNYKKKEYKFSQKELLENREFNSGVYAFKYKPLAELINKIQNDNVQKEIYLTDLISLFNKNNYSVKAVSLPAGRQGPKKQYVLMGFNNKSVLKEMNAIACELAYEKLKDIITFDDPDDFFIEENVIEEIIKMDKDGIPLDINLGKGVYIGKDVKLNSGVKISKNVFLEGSIKFGKNVSIEENVKITCFFGQNVSIENDVVISSNNIIKGNVTIGNKTRIESGVRITGSDQFPASVGNNSTIKGLTYIFGSEIGNNVIVEHSVIVKKKIVKPDSIKADIYHIKYYLPESEGSEAINDL